MLTLDTVAAACGRWILRRVVGCPVYDVTAVSTVIATGRGPRIVAVAAR